MDAPEAYGSSEDPEVRQAFSDSILHILRPLSVLEVASRVGSRQGKLDRASPDGSDSTRSALSEPFSDLDESYILLDQRKKKPGKDDGDDMMLLNQFTSEFRQVYDQLVSDKQDRVEESILPPDDSPEDGIPTSDEPIPTDFGVTDTDSFSPQFQSYIAEMLRKCDLKYHLDEKKKRLDQHRRRHRRVRKVQPVDPRDPSEPAERDSLSGMWRMLDAVSEPNGFPITDGEYDLYEDERFEWLMREKLPWHRLEVSKKKCEQWLKMGPTVTKADERRSRESQRASGHRRW
ncbi:uncharacterized protein LOC131289020 [Anopheles ziemanni]|uniref:uncharacterized protein LOC131259715 n=1 Tax=Anopheles coustani TaxID=139045 RepID=UPI002658D7F6|nr:uncharacterized protein LOC131259715 [Anopheles coustani]XP_058174195.1 uncharacterized protein LOC131289020 [Anopheles ziemanni]